MARFWDITVYLVMISLAIAFVNGMGVFALHYMEAPNQSATYGTNQVSASINQSTARENFDAFTVSVGLFAAALSFIINIATNTIGLYSTMTTIFHFPPIVAAFVTGFIGLIWLSFFIQFIARMGWGLVKD